MKELDLGDSGYGKIVKFMDEYMDNPECGMISYNLLIWLYINIYFFLHKKKPKIGRAERKLLSPYHVNKLLMGGSKIKFDETYHVCEKSNHLFYDENQEACSCTDSNPNRFSSDLVTPVATSSQIPLYKKLATYFATEKSRQSLLYRSKREEIPGLYRDVFDGSRYKRFKYLFENDYDIALALYIDGFNPQKRGSTHMVTFMAVILNLPPDIR
jgi:hypothetical protein